MPCRRSIRQCAIGRQVGEPLELHRGLSVRARVAGRADELLASVKIAEPETRASEYPHQFSGGMQQRAMIAMGLALDPELLIADEPTTALDVTVQAQVLKLLREIRDSSGASILFITHDLGIVAELCDWVYVMRDGEVVEDGPVERIFTAPQADYTRMLLAATPEHPPAARTRSDERDPWLRLDECHERSSGKAACSTGGPGFRAVSAMSPCR